VPADTTAGGGQNLVGKSLGGRYEITGRLGKGGMAVVYRAEDKSFGRTVAIKVLRTDVAKDPIAAKRLVREARAAGQLHHPHIITMHDVGESDGMVYIVMELLEGRELSELMEEVGPIGLVRSIEIGRQVASALAVAHHHGIIHRDIKPENLFLIHHGSGSDFVKMLDFSIAKLPTNMVTAALTRAGSVFGTPHYMAPEQVEGREVAPQTDLYALGAVLYESIVGEPPYDGDSVIDILLQHVRGTPPRLDAGGRKLPAGLADLVESLLAKKVADRPSSATEVERMLESYLAEARAIEGDVLDDDDDDDEPVSTLKLDADMVAAVNRAAAAAEKIPTVQIPDDAADDGHRTVALSALDLPDFPEPTPAAAPAGTRRTVPGQGSVTPPADLPEMPGDLPGDAQEDEPGGRTIVGHGLAAQVRAEAARIEAERAGKAAPSLSLDAPPSAPPPAPSPKSQRAPRTAPPASAAPASAPPAGRGGPPPPPSGRASMPRSVGKSTVQAPTAVTGADEAPISGRRRRSAEAETQQAPDKVRAAAAGTLAVTPEERAALARELDEARSGGRKQQGVIIGLAAALAVAVGVIVWFVLRG
jgi:serine/threonine-protein kinase